MSPCLYIRVCARICAYKCFCVMWLWGIFECVCISAHAMYMMTCEYVGGLPLSQAMGFTHQVPSEQPDSSKPKGLPTRRQHPEHSGSARSPDLRSFSLLTQLGTATYNEKASQPLPGSGRETLSCQPFRGTAPTPEPLFFPSHRVLGFRVGQLN